MTATFHSWGASDTQEGTGTVSPTFPSSIAADDLLVLVITANNTTQTFGPGTGWHWEGGSPSRASDETVNYYTKIAVGDETGTFGISVPTGSSGHWCTAQIARLTKTLATDQWEIGSTVAFTMHGVDTNANTTWSVTSGTSDAARHPIPIMYASDILFGAIAVNSGTARTWSSESHSCTGATFGAVSNISNTNIASEYTHRVYTTTLSAGPSTGTTINHTATLSSGTGMTGNEQFLLVRAVNRPGVVFQGDTNLGNLSWVFAESGMTIDTEADSGDLLIGLVAFKEGAVDSVTTPSGWTDGGTYSGGTGSIGVDTGRTAVKIAYVTADGSEAGVDFGGSGTSAMLGTIIRIQNPGNATWDVDSSGGSDTSTGTNWSTSMSMSTAGGVEVGDLILVLNTQQTDNMSGVWTSETFTGTGLTTNLLYKSGQAVQATDHMAVRMAVLEVLTTGSGNLTHAATASDSVNGAGVLVRIRRTIAVTAGDTAELFVDDDVAPDIDASITSSETMANSDVTGDSGLVEEETLTWTETDVATVEKTDAETMFFSDDMGSPVETSDISIVFNNNENSPGFDITITTDIALNEATMVRRDPSGLYADATVRGLDGIDISAGSTLVPDFEAPINTPVEYWFTYELAGESFEIGPILPTPEDYIPTQQGPYAESDFIKSVETPSLSRRVIVTEFGEVSRKGNVLGQYHVLGRKNPVVITDIMAGYTGSMSVVVLGTNQQASFYRSIDILIDQGDTLLFQSNNSESSTFLDFYFKITSVKRKRLTSVDYLSEPSDVGSTTDLFVEYTFDFIEVDRPATLGEAPSLYTWDTYYHQEFDDWNTWQEILDFRTSWLDVLRRAGEPKEEV
jgi:hypothetical protein